MRKFAAFIITHGRPDNVITYKSLMRQGYTGEVLFIVDNEDKAVDRYREKFGADRVVVFDKKAMADRTDEGNNFDDRRTTTHARNASFDIAEARGITHFVQLDDDYTDFLYRHDEGGKIIRRMDLVIEDVLQFLDNTPALSICFSQGGDHIGGFAGVRMWRKAMNSFFCRTDRRFTFVGSLNEDVNTYITEGARGGLFFTFSALQLNQKPTQMQAGGMTEVYLHRGTYVKSFSSVLFHPSGVRVAIMNTLNPRIHHIVGWQETCPKIVPHHVQRFEAA